MSKRTAKSRRQQRTHINPRPSVGTSNGSNAPAEPTALALVRAKEKKVISSSDLPRLVAGAKRQTQPRDFNVFNIAPPVSLS